MTPMQRIWQPDLRSWTITTGVALAVIFAVQFDSGSVAAAGVPLMCGIAGMLLRWTAMPVMLVMTLGYFLAFPIGLPLGLSTRNILRDSHLRISDMVLCVSVLAYLTAQYRLFHLTAESETPRGLAEKPWRPVIAVVLALVAGQGVWWLITHVEPYFGGGPLLRWKPSAMARFRSASFSTQSDGLSRFLLIVTLMAVLSAIVVFVLQLWRWQTLSVRAAKLVLIDTMWSGNRRELARQETWRAAKAGTLAESPNFDAFYRGVVRAIVRFLFLSLLGFLLYVYLHNGELP